MTTETPPTARTRRGLPVWVPLLGLIAAFFLAVIVGVRVCPVLSALVFPPEPPMPPGKVSTLQTQTSQGAGRDEWLFGTDAGPCEVLKYYSDRVGGCTYDIDTQCQVKGWGMAPRDGSSYPVGVCQSTQSIGPLYRVTWTIRVGAGYTQGGNTHVRITREVAN